MKNEVLTLVVANIWKWQTQWQHDITRDWKAILLMNNQMGGKTAPPPGCDRSRQSGRGTRMMKVVDDKQYDKQDDKHKWVIRKDRQFHLWVVIWVDKVGVVGEPACEEGGDHKGEHLDHLGKILTLLKNIAQHQYWATMFQDEKHTWHVTNMHTFYLSQTPQTVSV